MRILSGQFKNRAFNSPKGMETRPTSGKLREALFNICQGYIEGSRFLDLFAGSGAMGLEALSRGATKAVFVDSSRDSANIIRENLQTFDVAVLGTVYCLDVFDGMRRLEKLETSFDIIYADPPYGAQMLFHGEQISYSQRVLEILDTSPLLKEEGMLFLEDVAFDPTHLKHLVAVSSRKMGRATLQQFRKEAS